MGVGAGPKKRWLTRLPLLMNRLHRLGLAPLVLITVMLAPLMGAPPERKSKAPPIQPADWRTYNHSFKGWRYNPAENRLALDKVANLQLKWQFPPKGSKEVVEAINSTPSVVNGYVYFGTATHPKFYKLKPNGEIAWTYEPGDRGRLAYRQHQTTQGLVPRDGIYSSALVTRDSVYFADVAGVAYCLDRLTGNEKWALNTQFSERPSEAYFPKSTVGTLYSFGLPGEDEISKLGAGHE